LNSTQSADYYKDLGADEIRYIPETGELVFGENVYTKIQTTDSIKVNYEKENFSTNDLRPEHYFNCIQTNKTSGDTVKFEVSDDDQNIEYEVNFNQKIRVNTLGRDLMSPDVGRSIDELADKVQEIADAESRLTDLKAYLTNPKYSNNSSAVEQINYMIADAENEVKMKNQEMQTLFNQYITVFQNFQTDVTTLQSDSGARGEKLDMIATRVSDQYTNFTDLMSANEEVDYEDATMKYASADTVYSAALQVTSSVIKQTLLDYL
jgi:flagellar hook-associated protein 3 FlgL